MARIQLAELTAFVAVAEHRSFTKAAAQVGIALPTMSQTIRSLEERLGVRMFNRTTRSVALTEAGERLLLEVQPILEGIDHALESVNAYRDKPIGTLRLALERSAAQFMLSAIHAPLIEPFMAEYPAIRVELAVDDTYGDIISGRFDAGIRLGHRIERDMTILRMSPDSKVIAVAAPKYLSDRPRPIVPADLHDHDCIRFRAAWDGSILTWLFTNGEQQVDIAVDGQLVVNDTQMLLSTVLQGVGIAYLPETMVASHIAEARLIRLMDDWSRPLPGAYLYHPSRHQTPMPLQVFIKFVEAWRKRERQAERVSVGR